MTAATEMDAERKVAEAVRAEVGPRPVLLCGSRARGTAVASSDYDVVVVLPTASIPLGMWKLGRLAQSLHRELGVPVTLSPIPASRFDKSRSLYLWKLRREARVLTAPDGFALGEAGPAPLTPETEFSYLASAALYFLAPLAERGVTRPPLGQNAERGVRKSLLHLLQLGLLREGSYADSLDEALGKLSDQRLSGVAARLASEDGLLSLRDLLLAELETALERRAGLPVRTNARYVVLAALRGRLRFRALVLSTPIDRRLAKAAANLLRALGPCLAADPVTTRRAIDLLPFRLEGERSWSTTARAIAREWGDAHPLGAQ